VYSIGNFAFGTPSRWKEEYPGVGLVVTTVLGPAGLRELRVECIQTDNAVVAFQPRPCEPIIARPLLESLSPRLRVEGTTGAMNW
jgi:hypothetical protein